MEKLKMHSLDNVDENIKKIGKLFPNCITEKINDNGEIEYAIDFDKLKQELSDEIVEGNQERYQFTWPDKKKSMLLANTPIAKTLRPCKEESVDFDNTENLYIEGDNLEVLKLLQETYLGKIKMIYIDPPYNTGNDFVYEDNFSQKSSDYIENSGQFDEEGNRLVKNLESNGRFHTDWLNMMYPRLKLARNLLTEDGVIFISIDDNEVHNLRKLCDEIFGESNFMSNIIWQSTSGSNTGNKIVTVTEYVLVFSKNKDKTRIKMSFKNGKWKYKDKYFEKRGGYDRQKLDGKFTKSHFSQSLVYPIKLPNNQFIYPGGFEEPSGLWNWRWNKNKVEWGIKNGFIEFVENSNNSYGVYFKNYELVDNKNETRQASVPPKNFIPLQVASTSYGTSEINNLFKGELVFEFTKGTKFIQHILQYIELSPDDIILDFFSGSSTTADSIMRKNNENHIFNKFIMVQVPEITEPDSSANKLGYKNICEIGKERIRRAGKQIKEENPLTTQDLDIGFRVLKCDLTNMKDVYYNPEEYEADLFDLLEDNIKEDRTSEDLLFQVMLDLGILLSSKIEENTIDNKKIFNVADGYLIACFDENITEDIIIEIAKQKPYYFVMRDSSLDSDNVLTNFDQLFSRYSPDTIRKVL